jgi:hypothetical protein
VGQSEKQNHLQYHEIKEFKITVRTYNNFVRKRIVQIKKPEGGTSEKLTPT